MIWFLEEKTDQFLAYKFCKTCANVTDPPSFLRLLLPKFSEKMCCFNYIISLPQTQKRKQNNRGACDVGSMPINAVMINVFSLGQMTGQASMQSGAICFTAFNMAGFSHGPTSDSTAATTTKRQARQATLLSMAQVFSTPEMVLESIYCKRRSSRDIAPRPRFLAVVDATWVNPKLRLKRGRKGMKRKKQNREGQLTLEPSQNPQKSKVIQHLTTKGPYAKSCSRPSLEASYPKQEAPEMRGKKTRPIYIPFWLMDPCSGL